MTASDKTKDGGSLPALTWRTVWPGEWTCDNAGYIWADSLKGGRTHMIDVRGWGYLTGGGLGALGLKATDAERLQDDLGRLLCAAPDMLASLQTMRDYVSDRLMDAMAAGGKSMIDMVTEDLARVDAAISKATGDA
jgi:hypothetical protein